MTLYNAPLVVVSFVFSTLTFATCMAQPSSTQIAYNDSWMITPAFLCTIIFHLMTLILKPGRRFETIVPALFLCAMWGGSIAVTLHLYRPALLAHEGLVTCRCIGSSVEVIIMAAISVRAIVENRKSESGI